MLISAISNGQIIEGFIPRKLGIKQGEVITLYNIKLEK